MEFADGPLCQEPYFLGRKFQSQTEWVQRLGDFGDALNQPLKMDMIHSSKGFLWTMYNDVLKHRGTTYL